MVEVTGNVIYHIKKVIIEFYGKEKYEEIIKNTSPGSYEVLHDMIISTEWYDVKIYNELLQSFLDIMGEEELDKIQKELAQNQFTGLFGFFVKFVDAKKIMERSEKMWQRLYSEGEFKVTQFTDDKISIQIKDFPFNQAGFKAANFYMAEIIRIVTKKNLTTKPRKLGDKLFQFEYSLQD